MCTHRWIFANVCSDFRPAGELWTERISVRVYKVCRRELVIPWSFPVLPCTIGFVINLKNNSLFLPLSDRDPGDTTVQTWNHIGRMRPTDVYEKFSSFTMHSSFGEGSLVVTFPTPLHPPTPTHTHLSSCVLYFTFDCVLYGLVSLTLPCIDSESLTKIKSTEPFRWTKEGAQRKRNWSNSSVLLRSK